MENINQYPIRKLYLKHIRVDMRIQPRDEIDEKTRADYKEAMQNGAKFPPGVVFYDGNDNWLAGGFHRYFASEDAKIRHFEAEVREGTFDDAWLFARGNNKHGKSLTNEEKNRVVRELLAKPNIADWSDRAIAAFVGVTHPFVAKVRKELSGNGYHPEEQIERESDVSDPHLSETEASENDADQEQESGDDQDANSDEEEFDDTDPFGALDGGEPLHLEGRQEADIVMSMAAAASATPSQDSEAETPGAEEEQEVAAEPTIEDIVDALPLAQALSKYKHIGQLFKQQALLWHTCKSVVNAARAKGAHFRFTKGPVTNALETLAKMPDPSEWEGCPRCKGALRAGERLDPCELCEGVGFTTRRGEGVSADVVSSHAEEFNTLS